MEILHLWFLPCPLLQLTKHRTVLDQLFLTFSSGYCQRWTRNAQSGFWARGLNWFYMSAPLIHIIQLRNWGETLMTPIFRTPGTQVTLIFIALYQSISIFSLPGLCGIVITIIMLCESKTTMGCTVGGTKALGYRIVWLRHKGWILKFKDTMCSIRQQRIPKCHQGRFLSLEEEPFTTLPSCSWYPGILTAHNIWVWEDERAYVVLDVTSPVYSEV